MNFESYPYFNDIDLPKNIKFTDYIRDNEAETNSLNVQSQLNCEVKQTSSSNMGDLEEVINRQMKVVTPEDSCDVIVGYDHILADIYKSVITQQQCFIDNTVPTAVVANYLLYGLPGTGKSTLLKVAAVRCSRILKVNITILNVTGSLLMSKYVGETQKMIDTVYRLADENAPTILCFDEIDGLCQKRQTDEPQHARSLKGALLIAMQGFLSHPRVVTIAGTNKPDELDIGFLRRFPIKCHITLPTPLQRIAIIKVALVKTAKLSQNDIEELKLDEKKIALETEGFTGDDIVTAVQKAVKHATLFYYNGQSLTDDEFKARLPEIESGSIPATTIMQKLTMAIILEMGIRKVAPQYGENDPDKLSKFALAQRSDEDHTEQNIDTISKTQGWDFSSIVCCCSRW